MSMARNNQALPTSDGAGGRGRPATALLTLCLAALLALAVASPAAADSASITFTDATGAVDPVVGVGRTVTLSGTSTVSQRVYVRFRPAGGAPCAPSASSDSGGASFNGFSGDTFYGTNVNGNFTLQKTGTWSEPGTFMFCIYLAATESTPTVPFVQHITFRSPVGSISATVAPIAPLVGQATTVTITGSSESPKRVYASVRAAGGAPCAVSYDADPGRGLVAGVNVNGAFSVTETTTPSEPGNYMICLWLAESSSDGTPVAGPQSALFTVAAPCVVPALERFVTLANYLKLLSGANCKAGTQRYSASRTYPRRAVMRVTPAAGTTLAPQASVALLISTGRPCRVPRLLAGTRVSTAKSRLRAAGCTPGRVRTVRSRRARGTVIAYLPRSGTKLKPRAGVAIRVSGGSR